MSCNPDGSVLAACVEDFVLLECVPVQDSESFHCGRALSDVDDSLSVEEDVIGDCHVDLFLGEQLEIFCEFPGGCLLAGDCVLWDDDLDG